MSTGTRHVSRYFLFLAAATLVAGAAVVGFSFYERLAMGVIRLGTGDPLQFGPYYLARFAVAVLLSAALIGGVYRLRSAEAGIDRPALSLAMRQTAYVMLGVAAACFVVFLVDPARFAALAVEDGPIEWPSALLPFAASLISAYSFVLVLRSPRRNSRRNITLILTALSAVALFVIGMEEISWMQRIFNVRTPDAFQVNEQNEINLHNFNSLIINIVYRTMVFGFLIVLPFIVETAPPNRLFDRMADFLPSRLVLAASAPVVAFDYNAWNFFLGPLLFLLAAAILTCQIVAARRRGDRQEAVLFTLLLVFVLGAQTSFLAFATQATWTISEYRELFLVAGLVIYSWEVAGRVALRYRVGRRARSAAAA